VCHALTTNLGLRDFDSAFLANHTTVLQALVLAAQTLIVLDGTEDLRAKQAVSFRFERAVIDDLKSLSRSFISLSPAQC
jgi:hypothetical protein